MCVKEILFTSLFKVNVCFCVTVVVDTTSHKQVFDEL